MKSCDALLCEDTRTSGRLLKHYEISRPLQAYHAHNEHKVLTAVINRLQAGETLGVLTDAGTPGISDPGFLLVRACVAHGVAVECLPGPTAFVPALVCSGLPSDRFTFEGFLPQKKGRQNRLLQLLQSDCTVVLYESPYRVVKLLQQLADAGAGERAVCASREVSKMFEEHIRGTVAEVLRHFTAHEPRGEFVVCLAPAGFAYELPTSEG